MLRWSILGFTLGLLIAIVPSCSSTNGGSCSPSFCSGCCDSSGICQGGTAGQACGKGGLVCTACSSGQTCQSGACTTTSNPDSGTPTDAGCTASTCTGCCDGTGTCQKPGVGVQGNGACGVNGTSCQACTGQQVCNALGSCQNSGGCTGCVDNSGQCQGGTSNGVCGKNGQTCQSCTGGATCQGGVCTGGCGPTTCSTGCCDPSGNCIAYASQTTGQCGTGGTACGMCSGTATCSTSGANAGTCQGGASCNSTNCAAGCCNGNSCVLYANQTNSSCGTAGAACAGCNTGLTCNSSGVCTGGAGCNASNCPSGCCNATSCVLYGGQNPQQCGTAGATCAACGATQACSAGGCIPGTANVTILSHLNQLPTPWTMSDLSVLKKDDTGTGAAAHVGDVVLVTSSLSSNMTPCPLPFTSTKTGKTYCDGFNAVDSSSNAAVVDTFAYFGTANNCGAALSDAGTGQHYTNLKGIWEDNYNATTMVDTFVIAPIDCDGLGLGPDTTCNGGTGCTATPPSSTDVHTLLGGTPAANEVVSLHGVVTGKWSGNTGTWGCVIQDTSPNAAGLDAIHVHHGADGGYAGVAPNVGDYIQAAGIIIQPGSKYWELEL